MGLAARKQKIELPADLAIDAEVDLGTAGGGYFLQARLNVSGDRDVAQSLVDEAHQTCVQNSPAGNIDRHDQSGVSEASLNPTEMMGPPIFTGQAIPHMERNAMSEPITPGVAAFLVSPP